MAEPYPWERRADEPPRAWAGFIAYRDMPLRDQSITHTAKVIGEPVGTVYAWASKYAWPERGRAWSMELDRRRREELSKETVEYSRRIAAEAAAYSRSLTLPVQILLDRISSNPQEMEWFRAMPIENLYGVVVACARVWPTVVNVEREARGYATSEQPLLPVGDPQSTLTDTGRMKEVLAILEQAGAMPEPSGNGRVIDVTP